MQLTPRPRPRRPTRKWHATKTDRPTDDNLHQLNALKDQQAPSSARPRSMTVRRIGTRHWDGSRRALGGGHEDLAAHEIPGRPLEACVGCVWGCLFWNGNTQPSNDPTGPHSDLFSANLSSMSVEQIRRDLANIDRRWPNLGQIWWPMHKKCEKRLRGVLFE